jgi:WD40-like Beta Propeller Repeat
MSPDEFAQILHTRLDEITIPSQGWDTAHEHFTTRRHRKRVRYGAALSAATVVAALSFALGAVIPSGAPHHARSYGGSGEPAAKEPVLSATRVNATMAAEPGFVVFLSAKSLLGSSLTSDQVIAGNSTWPVARNNVLLAVPKQNGEEYWSPSVNPSHSKIVYVTGTAAQIGEFDGEGNLEIANINGTGAHVVTHANLDTSPKWSPDGKQIAFVRNGHIWLMSSTGSGQHPLRLALPVNTLAWSPNGQELAVGSGTGPVRIAIVNIKRASYTWFTPAGGIEQYDPSWSPNGKQLVYGQTGPNALFISNLNGTGTRQLTVCRPPRCTQDIEPVWSPNGSEIAFVRSVYGVQQIAVVAAKGGPVRMLTRGPDQHNLPSW